jgi:hypothetical protein
VFKRLFWLLVGVLCGVALVVAVQRKARQYTPQGLAEDVAEAARRLRADLREAIEEGRGAMAEREAEIRSQIGEGSPPGGP